MNTPFPEITSLKSQASYKDESPVIWYRGRLVEASRFGTMGFQEVCQLVEFSRESIIALYSALQDVKGIFGYKGVVTRKTGEPYYTHPLAVALMDLIEFGNRDYVITIAELGHDTPEDSYMMLGNENHPNRKQCHEVFTTLEALTFRYGERAAKIMLSVCKPHLPPGKEKNDNYLYHKYSQVLNKFPDIRQEAAQVKAVDRIHNIRTPADDEFMAKKIIETYRFVLPVVEQAGEKYYEALKKELGDRMEILTIAQRASCRQRVKYILAA